VTKIYLFPKNARGLPEEEFEPFIEDLKQEHPDLTSEYVWFETRAYGVTLWEIVTIYIAVRAADAAIDATVGELVRDIIDMGKKWVQRHRDAKTSHHRPFALTVRDADGNVLAAIDIDREGVVTDAMAKRPPKELPPFDLLPDDIQ
jgi:hypothetical protein